MPNTALEWTFAQIRTCSVLFIYMHIHTYTYTADKPNYSSPTLFSTELWWRIHHRISFRTLLLCAIGNRLDDDQARELFKDTLTNRQSFSDLAAMDAGVYKRIACCRCAYRRWCMGHQLRCRKGRSCHSRWQNRSCAHGLHDSRSHAALLREHAPWFSCPQHAHAPYFQIHDSLRWQTDSAWKTRSLFFRFYEAKVKLKSLSWQPNWGSSAYTMVSEQLPTKLTLAFI